MTKHTTLILAMALAAACSGELGSSTSLAAGGQLTLAGTSDGLVLRGTPLDATYRATYPNPDALEAMIVRLRADGRLETTCRTGESRVVCSETPFFTESVVVDGMLWIRVWDLFGTIVTEEEVGRAEEALRAEPTDDVAGDDGKAEGYHTPDFPDDGTTTTTDLPEPDDGGGSGSACPRPEEKARFCDGVNEQLVRLGVGWYTIDCAEIPDDFELELPEPDLEGAPLDRCRDAVEPIEQELEAYFEARGDGCGEVQLRNWEENTRMRMLHDGICDGSPLVLDLDGDGVQLGALDDGVAFDLLGDGTRVHTAWPSAGDGFLALDQNGNGVVDDATELFGSATGGEAFDDGFAALARLDDDGTGIIDGNDAVFDELRVWVDADQDGECTPGEMSTLAGHGIRALSLRAQRLDAGAAVDAHGNSIPLVSTYERRDGRAAALVDVWLRYRPLDAADAADAPAPSSPTPDALMCPLQ